MPCSETSPGSVECGTAPANNTVYLSNLFNPNNTSLEAFFNTLFVSAIAIGAALAVIRLAYAGVVYMTTDLVTSKQNARQMIADVVLGLIVLLAIWVILFQINPDLLNLDVLKSVRTTP
jgi:ABC-type sugar transport system permease subunit